MNGSRIIRLKPEVEWHTIDDEVVALDLGASSYLAVNDTGAHLWPLVAAGTTEAELTDALMAGFPIGAERAQADAAAFVERLRVLSLVVEEA